MNSDLQIAGDPLAVPHLLPPVPQHPTTIAEFAGLARTLAEDRPGWAALVEYDATSRWYHRMHTGPGYEVWLLSWVPGQGSGLHDHGRSAGIMTVLDGQLTEHGGPGRPGSVPAGARTAARVLRPGGQRVFAPGDVHEVVNNTLAPAVSLHVYFPGLTVMTMRQDGSGHLAAPKGQATATATGAPAALEDTSA